MANNSMRLRSLLKSPNSPRRHHHNVSFEDQHNTIRSLELSKSLNSTIFSGGHSHSLQFPPDSTSFLNGSSLDEITCPDIDDLLPKTDYTYARTVSYRKKHLNKKRSVSPNMSRRRVDGNPQIFISDDESEDGYEEEYDNDAIISKSRNFYSHQDLHRQDALDDHSNEEVKSRSAVRRKDYISTPVTPHDMQHISVHDHYYKGMLLRSGSHIKGTERQSRYGQSSSGSDAFSQGAMEALVPTYRSDYEERESRARNRNQNSSDRIIKTTTTTTVYTYGDEDEHGGKKMLDTADDEEMKLKLDESQSEKNRTEEGSYVLQNLDGLDVEDEISDVEDFEMEARSSYRGVDTRRQHSSLSFFNTIITTIITTIVTMTTTAAESVSSVAGPVISTVAMPVTVPARWMWRAIVASCSWILRQSATILLIEMESKNRRRRGCCLWFLPFLLLLPLALLAGHYAGHMKHHVGSFMSESEVAISSMWVGLWSERERHSPVVIPPPLPPQSVVSNVERQEVDMTQINYHIQQTILQMFSERQQEIPPGLTSDQVKEIVQAMLAKQIGSSRVEIDSHITAVSGVVKQDIADLNGKLLALESQIQESDRAAQIVAGNIDKTKASFQSMSKEQRTEWLVASQMLESKFLDLRNDVNEMMNQNAALVAMLQSCCQNNTALAASIRGHMVSIFSEMGSEDHDSALSGLMAWMQANYVERGQLDRKLSSVAAEITDNLNSAMAERIAAEVKNTGNTEVKASIVSASIDVTAVKSIVEEALVQFSADRVGRPDFALESAGGSVLSVRCSETYYRKTALVSIFGVPLYYTSNSPRAVIQPNVHPGECWAFKGSSGFVVIQLSQLIQPTGFTLEHIPLSLSPTGNIDSAPKSFSAIGLKSESDTEGINLGNYTYLDNGKPIQHFPVQNHHPGVYEYIEMRVLSNHGNPEYTCIYRFRVHGLP